MMISLPLWHYSWSHMTYIHAACICVTSPSYFASLAVCLLIVGFYNDNQISCHPISMKFQIITVCTDFHTLSYLTSYCFLTLCLSQPLIANLHKFKIEWEIWGLNHHYIQSSNLSECHWPTTDTLYYTAEYLCWLIHMHKTHPKD